MRRKQVSYISRKILDPYTAMLMSDHLTRFGSGLLYLQHFFYECGPLLQYANSPRILPYGAPSPFIG